jgi:hypothetical protein
VFRWCWIWFLPIQCRFLFPVGGLLGWAFRWIFWCSVFSFVRLSRLQLGNRCSIGRESNFELSFPSLFLPKFGILLSYSPHLSPLRWSISIDFPSSLSCPLPSALLCSLPFEQMIECCLFHWIAHNIWWLSLDFLPLTVTDLCQNVYLWVC